MSWDIGLVSGLPGIKSVNDINLEDYDLEKLDLEELDPDNPDLGSRFAILESLSNLGPKDQVLRAIASVFPTVDFSDPEWGVLEGDGFSIEFNMGDEDPVDAILLHVRGGGDAVQAIDALCNYAGWVAIDYAAGDLMDFGKKSLKSWQKWQEFRDEVVDLVSRETPDDS